VTELSVVPSAVSRIKAVVRRFSVDAAATLLDEVTAYPSAPAVVARLQAAVRALENEQPCMPDG
jgi:phosphoenolpyruvate-protein kinase (PTS system EI component)